MVMTVDKRGQRDKAKQTGALLRQYRERLGLTQHEAEKLTGVRREYIGSIETGRIAIIYPEPFNALRKVYGFPGWEILEAMGYETDAAGAAPQGQADVVRLATMISLLSPADRQVIEEMVHAMRKRSRGSEQNE